MKKTWVCLILISFFSCSIISDTPKQKECVPPKVVTVTDTLTYNELNSFLQKKHLHPYDIRWEKMVGSNSEFLYVRGDTVFIVTKINNTYYTLTYKKNCKNIL